MDGASIRTFISLLYVLNVKATFKNKGKKINPLPHQTQLFSQASRRNSWEGREDRIHNWSEESQHSVFLVISGCHNCEENPSWASLEQRCGLGTAEQPETITPRNRNCCTPHIQDANSDAHMRTLLTVSWPSRAQQKAYRALHSFQHAQEAFQRSSWYGFPVHMLLLNQAHPSTPMFCHGTALGWVEMPSQLFLDAEVARIHQHGNSGRRSTLH